MSGEGSGSRTSHDVQSTTRGNVLQPHGWPQPKGYSNGMVASGRIVMVAGQIGWNPVKAQIENDDFVLQVRQALVNIEAVLRTAGAIPSDVVRLTWYVTRRDEYIAAQKDIGRVYREIFGDHFPPMSVVVVAGLLEARAKVEIEATAVLPVR